MKVAQFSRIAPQKKLSLEEVSETWSRRDLLFFLIKREIKGAYTSTSFGIFWVLLQPLATALVLTVVMQSFVKVPTGNLPYVLVLFTGLTPWFYFANTLQRASQSLANNSFLLSKVYFPRIIILLVPILVVFIDYLVLSTVTMILVVIFNKTISLNWLFFVVPTIIEVLLVLGLGLWFSSLSVYFKDTVFILSIILQAGVFVSPVYYLPSLVPVNFLPLYKINPMVSIINAWRWAFLGTDFEIIQLAYPLILAVVLLVSGYAIYTRVQQNIVDIL